MKNTLILIEKAIEDLKKLPPEVRTECAEMLKKLENNIHLGQPLHNKCGMNLAGHYKIYFDKARYRIVYRKVGVNSFDIVGVEKSNKLYSEVIAIGERNGLSVYKAANERING